MSLNEAMSQLANAQQQIEQLQNEVNGLKQENKCMKEKQFVNSLKLSANRRGW